MEYSANTLHSASNQITGNLGGKFLNCSFHPVAGGSLPPGKYKLSRPMHNSVYGTFALATLMGSTRGAGASRTQWIEKQWLQKQWLSAGWVTKDWINKDWVNNSLTGAGDPGVFVIAGSHLSGRNGIVVTRGFNELMAALGETGGGMIIVS